MVKEWAGKTGSSLRMFHLSGVPLIEIILYIFSVCPCLDCLCLHLCLQLTNPSHADELWHWAKQTAKFYSYHEHLLRWILRVAHFTTIQTTNLKIFHMCQIFFSHFLVFLNVLRAHVFYKKLVYKKLIVIWCNRSYWKLLSNF